MKNTFVKLGFIAILVLTLVSCQPNCEDCRRECPECQGHVDPPPVPVEQAAMYTIGLQAVKSMLAAAPQECAALCFVDIPEADNPQTPGGAYAVIAVDMNKRPLPNPGSWMKGSKRCPPVCDVMGPGENIANTTGLAAVDVNEQQQITDRIRQAPPDRTNCLYLSRAVIDGLMGKPDALVLISCPANGEIGISVVPAIKPNTGNPRREHINL